MESIEFLFSACQQALFEGVVSPFMFAIGLGNLLEDGYVATGWLLVGLLQLAVLVAVIGPLQRWRPVEPVTDRMAIRTDILYTLIHRLGLFRVALFFMLQPVFDAAFAWLHGRGFWRGAAGGERPGRVGARLGGVFCRGARVMWACH